MTSETTDTPTAYRTRLRARLAEVRERIGAAAERAGRDPTGVGIVAVTKGHPDAAVEAALEEGLRELAENRISSLEERGDRFAGRGVRWHMVGHLQRRKAPRLFEVPGIGLLHSLDSLRLAERLDRIAPEGTVLPVLLQVNTSGEDSKGGFEPEALGEEAEAVLALPALRVEGVMTMAPFTDDEAVLRGTFRRLRELHEGLGEALDGYRGRHLSMGMTHDYEIAVEEGSTLVRLGTALFGERPG